MHNLAVAAEKEAKRFLHGYVSGTESNLHEIIASFPGWTLQEADGVWCAAFVYPVSYTRLDVYKRQVQLPALTVSWCSMMV